jgi:periplasmic copper chaperone A
LLAAAACLLLGACSSRSPPVTIEDAWSPATPPGATVAAAYLKITAHQADVLLSGTTPAAGRAEMHTTIEDGGMMRMRPLETVAAAAGETVRFEPGGRHFMLTDLQAPLAAGSSFPMTVRFRNAGAVTIEVRVQPPNRSSADR